MLLTLNFSTFAKRLTNAWRKLSGPKRALRSRVRLDIVEALESRELLTTFTVTTAADTVNAGDGLTSLREALNAANASLGADTIVFAASANGTISLTQGELFISDPVSIIGNTPANTIVDAHGASRVFNLTNSAGNVTFNSMTIKNGKTTSDGIAGSGAGINSASTGTLSILNSLVTGNVTTGNGISGNAASGAAIFTYNNTPLTIQNSTISGNSTTGAAAGGGAIYGFNGGALTITDSLITGNTTAGNTALGGAIYWYNGSIALSNATVSYNSTSGNNSSGGAIFSAYAPITMQNGGTLFVNTTAGSNALGGAVFAKANSVSLINTDVAYNGTTGPNSPGGAVYSATNTVTITGTTVRFNKTTGSNSPGGAMHLESGNLTLLNSAVTGNFTTNSNSPGGGISTGYSGAVVAITSSTISGNYTAGAGSYGGGVRVQIGTLNVLNSTISGNSTASAGGGLSVNAATMTLTNTTVAFNSNADLTFPGGGVFAFQGNVTLNNSIVALNTNAGATDLSPGTGTLTINNSLIGNNLGSGLTGSATPNGQGNLIGTNVAPINPLLGTLANNGGPTNTHALLPNSSALNRGSNAIATTAGLTLDQRGLPRVSNTTVDMGAFEFQVPSASFSTAASSVLESDGTFAVTVNLAAASTLPVTIPFTVSGTANNPADFTIAASPLVIPAGQTSGTIQINLIDTVGFEPSETVILTFGTLVNATPGTITSTTVTINDIDLPPAVTFSAATQTVSEGVGIVAVTVNLGFSTGFNASIPFTVSGSANNPADFTIASSPVVIPAGQTSGTINVTIVNDTTIENDETIILTLGNPTNARPGNITALTLTITDNDANVAPTLTGGSGTVTFVKNQGAVNLMPNVIVTAPGGATSLGKVEISFFIPKKGLLSDVNLGNPSDLGTVSITGPTTFKKAGGTHKVTIDLNAGVTATEVQNFLRGITFSAKKLDPAKGPLGRKIDVKVFDRQGAGTASNTLTTQIRANRK